MPIGGLYAPEADPDATDDLVATAPVPDAVRGQVLSDEAGLLPKAAAAGQLAVQRFSDFRQREQTGVDNRQPADVLNERYGVEGYLRFNAPATDADAALQAAQARQREWRDYALSHTRANPLSDLGASLSGAITDPLGLPLMIASDGLGEAALGALGLRGAAAAGDAGMVMSRVGRLANLGRVPLEGAINQVPYVGVNAALSNYVGDDYSFGDALRDIAVGAVFHTGGKALGWALKRSAPGAEGQPFDEPFGAQAEGPDGPSAYVPPAGVPDAVSALSPNARLGAWVKAVDDVAAGQPVDVGQYVARELEPPPGSPPEVPPPISAEPIPAGAPPDLTPPAGVEAEPAPTAPNLMGEITDQFVRDDPGNLDLRAPGRAAEPADARIEAPPPAAGEGGKPRAADQLIAADPELKAMSDDLQRYAQQNGLELTPEARDDPNTLAEAIRAAAVCLGEEL